VRFFDSIFKHKELTSGFVISVFSTTHDFLHVQELIEYLNSNKANEQLSSNLYAVSIFAAAGIGFSYGYFMQLYISKLLENFSQQFKELKIGFEQNHSYRR
jgi:hypothetical protein